MMIDKPLNDKIRTLYLQELTKMVQFGTKPAKSQVRYPNTWIGLENHISGDDPITIQNTDNVWVWSDLHFFHKNIIRFSDRPFMNVSEMNQHLVDNFNEYVGPDDISIWVGDIGFNQDGFINELLDQCNGYKILVIGNHDWENKKLRRLNFDESHLFYTLELPECDLVFTHYPLFDIPNDCFNFHGHKHAKHPNTGHPLHYNVNCEMHSYRPVRLSELVQIAKTRLTSIEEDYKWTK